MKTIEIYDTTLRDGTQAEDISLTLEDKLLITERLDTFGIHYIEGGMPASNPKDAEYFRQVKDMKLKTAVIAAFGSTHRPGVSAEDDTNLRALVEAGTECVTIFGKTWDFHVRHALGIENDENLRIIHDSFRFLKSNVKKVFFDAEHFFQGYINNPGYAIECLKAAVDGGADCLVLCDTNGGCLPEQVHRITTEVIKSVNAPVGIHAHNDSDCAVANTLEAVRAGAVQVQGTINGLGERCGNANLCSIIPNLQLKLGYEVLGGSAALTQLRDVSRYVTEIANMPHFKRQPYVGDSAFAHKGGMHVSAIIKHSSTYEHIEPALVGNSQRILISDLAGKSTLQRKAEEFGVHMGDANKILEILKRLENQGYQFEGAEASFELMIKKETGQYKEAFEFLGFQLMTQKTCHESTSTNTAIIKMKLPDGELVHTAAEGNGPVNALDNALRKALERYYPALKEVSLHDYKVRVLTGGAGTSSGVRVLIESGDHSSRWGTVGVSPNVIEASWHALVDSIEYKLHKDKLIKE
ncbi:citramalate synthase [Candidatus Magnetominusculus dajiuhuensis]|uniref:citramalate synthase n=1 Tax=Candidatus Magnetominusculus dajiuhuensis TaxID=3137712 RepID=UPI003B43751B